MRELGAVVSGHPYELPDGWPAVEDDILVGALTRAREALRVEASRNVGDGPGRLERYFDPALGYAGASFNGLDRATGAVNRVTSSDLLAVTLLSIDIEPLQVRQLLEDNPKRVAVTSALAAVPRDVPLSEFSSGTRDYGQVLMQLYELYSELMKTPKPTAKKWVFASKLCARKFPNLMPVRDNVVCEYLADKPLTSHGFGEFKFDLQVFAYVMSDPSVRTDLNDLQSRLRQKHGPTVMDAVPALRILDVALWMAGIDAGLGRRPARPEAV